MDLASIIGLILCFAMCMFGIIQAAGISNIVSRYVDIPSAIITFGGSFFAVMAMKSMSDYVGGLKSFSLVFKVPTVDVKGMIQKLLICPILPEKRGFYHWKKLPAIWMMNL